MKRARFFSILVLLSLLIFITSSIPSVPASMAAQPSDLLGWQVGVFPPDTFQYARHDGAFVPGPALEAWANKIYFPGGRTSPTTESPVIWMYDPVESTFTDTRAVMIEDVSNYNANLILDDGTGRGPAIYVIGGTDADHGHLSLGMVQRYYPKTNEVEALPTIDNWNGKVGGNILSAQGTAVYDDIIYVFGGWETYTPPYFGSATWIFDPKQPSGSRWIDLGHPLHTPRSYIMSAVQGGKIYAFGGVGSYIAGELDPVDTVEVLDPNNLGIGWTLLAPLPAPGGEGRGFGFDVDTRNSPGTVAGTLYVVAPNDWPAVSSLMYEYDVAANTWYTDVPSLTTPVADVAGAYVPLCTSDPTDGLPGMWLFGGRLDESCDPPDGPTQYYPLACEGTCTPFSSVTINGPLQLMTGETGVYSATAEPIDASAPATVLWNNGESTPVTSYIWDSPGTYTVEITATNCEGSGVVTDTLTVEVTSPCTALVSAAIDGPTNLMAGETGVYTVSWTPLEATPPIEILWSNGMTGTVAEFAWEAAGSYNVGVAVTNCGGPVEANLPVEVVPAAKPVWMPMILRQ